MAVDLVADIEVRDCLDALLHIHRAIARPRTVKADDLGNRAIDLFPEIDRPLILGPEAGEHDLVFRCRRSQRRGGEGQQESVLADGGIDDRRQGLDLGDGGFVVVEAPRPVDMTQFAEIRGIGCGHLGAAGARIDAVGEQLHAGIADTGLFDAQRIEGVVEGLGGDHAILGRQQEGAADDTVADIDLVEVRRDLQFIDRMQHQPDTVIVRLLGLKGREPADRGGGRIRRQLTLDEGGRDVDALIELFLQRRSAESRADGAADADHPVEVVARRQLTDLGVAKIAIVFKPPSQIQVQAGDHLGRDVDIAGIAGPRMAASVERRVTGEGLRARTPIIGIGLARGDGEGVTARFATEGDI